MRLLIALMLGFALLFGCTGEEQKPPIVPEENGTPSQNQTKPPVVIIVEPQKNQSVTGEGKNDTELPPDPVLEESYVYTPDALMGVYFMNITDGGSHGNAVLIKKGDFDMLIDGGTEDMGPLVVDFLRSYEVDDLEVLVSSNADPRNYGGLALVDEMYDIESFWWNGDHSEGSEYDGIVKGISDGADETIIAEAGYVIEHNGIKLTVLNPQPERSGDINNDAIVILVEDRELALLLTSNIQTGAQGELVNKHKDRIKVDVMQAPYYGVGAGTGTIGIMLITAEPEEVIICGSSKESAEDGGDRSPFRRLMDQYGITYYENYATGPIRITSGPEGYVIDELGK